MREAVIVHVSALCDPLLDADDLFYALVHLERALRSWGVPLLIYVPGEASPYAQWWAAYLESAALRVIDEPLDERLRQVWWIRGWGCDDAPPVRRADRVREFAVEPGAEPRWGSVLDAVATYRALVAYGQEGALGG
ncbi:hypothetical protein [Microbacterium lacticum]|uniref:Uncharacterized protein n=1 Tax=Microbacterium lacticum TaxID=33885 RepID=A0A4Y3UNY2_9MICO|nr:hypothetical protein [Microbacterium lacticum]TQM90976.1 hypothetical protein FHX68_2830 [Microbacterium lacticum]GEB96063.1 hypothetical protein MLA01_22820 [Microbacterium lacticum]GGI71572.1 hypothetical protein GCM10009724_23090 [Microbacterium lacticum]